MIKRESVKLLLSLALIFLLSNALAADSIINYSVPQTIRINETVSIYGQLLDSDGNAKVDSRCEFYLLDINGFIISRADSVLTDGKGYFSSSEYKLTTPLYDINSDYNAVTNCDFATADSSFSVQPMNTLNNSIFWWWVWIWNLENIVPLALVLFAIFVMVLLYFMFNFIENRRGGR